MATDNKESVLADQEGVELDLDSLEIEELAIAPLDEDTKAHPENLASCYFNCTDASGPVLK